MKKRYLILSLLALISTGAICQMNANDSSNKKAPAPQNRNMFGLGIPRGLTKTSDGLADGYVVYAVPNSPYINLVNRKGEVVHQWKGNYGVMEAYIMDDGSIFQGAADPDARAFSPFGSRRADGFYQLHYPFCYLYAVFLWLWLELLRRI